MRNKDIKAVQLIVLGLVACPMYLAHNMIATNPNQISDCATSVTVLEGHGSLSNQAHKCA